MIPKFFLPYLRLGHGLFGLALFAAFVYQGRLGWLIRRGRQGGYTRDYTVVRRHRALGSSLAALLPIGYLGGLILTYVDHGIWIKFPVHLAAGSLLVVAVTSTWLVSREIRAVDSPWRTVHFVLGFAILALFLYQVFLGLNILL